MVIGEMCPQMQLFFNVIGEMVKWVLMRSEHLMVLAKHVLIQKCCFNIIGKYVGDLIHASKISIKNINRFI